MTYRAKWYLKPFYTNFGTSQRARTGKREVLNKSETGEILAELNRFFENRVEVKRIRHGEHQTLETLINEEAQLFAKYLRGGE